MKKLLLIDGNSILNRQYFGVRPLTNSAGVFTHAVYGFVNVLLNQLDALHPDAVAVAFDVHAPTFRHKMYDAYKAGRHGTPPELLMQFPYAKRFLTAMGIPVLETEGYEADDWLGTLSALWEKDGGECFILTGDRDSLQLISDKTTVLLAKNNENVPYTPERFEADYGVRVEQFVDMKALMGDSSDNIPGVAGVGEKTAAKLIATYGSLDGIYEHIDEVKASAKVLTNLREQKEQAYLSQELARIVRDMPTDLLPAELPPVQEDRAALRSLFAELEFAGYIKRMGLDEDVPEIKAAEELPVEAVTAEELAAAKLTSPVALWLTEDAIELCDGSRRLSCNLGEGLFAYETLDGIADFFQKTDLAFAVYDLKTLLHSLDEILPHFDAASFRCSFDILLAAYVINSSDSAPTLAKIAGAYLGAPVESAEAILRLIAPLTARMEADECLALYETMELPLARVLYNMEKRGFLVDRAALQAFSVALEIAAAGDMAEIYRMAGHEFNINSPKQLGEVLFDELKLPFFKKTKTGYSTNAEVLEKLRPIHPIIDLILDYRQVTKLRSTYAEGLLAVADEGGRVHTTFKQALTATGRLSSTEPNLQNIPIRTELGRELRRAFVAREGYTLVDADYSQIELRLLAHCAGDPIMIDAFRKGTDIHTVTASQVFGVPEEEVTPELRKRAKAVNFGIVYGISDFALAQDLGITKSQAGEYIRSYKETYSGVDAYLHSTIEEGKEKGFVKTLFGRRRYIPELTSSKAMMRAFGERVAMNSPIQGSAADIIKVAMIRVEDALAKSGMDATLILQVHDELILEVRDDCVEAAAALLKIEMERAFDALVPLTAEVSHGKTWYECK
ncbi:MAG: DNA polymerase I [Clostridia bacterium]|nr:DNA polymerase I [Clostridia bacterium]